MKRLLIAVDGGGSSTRLWVLDEEGTVLAQGRGGPSSVQAVGVERATRSVEEALQEAGLKGDDPRLALAAVTMAGIDRDPERSRIRENMEQMFPGARIVLEHDASAALLAGTLGGPGVLLLSGTGAISVSRSPEGEMVRVGGWGYMLDDIGSGFWIGIEAARRALRGLDGRGAPTALAEALERTTGVATVLDLTGPVNGGVYDRTAIARWAPLVLEAADGGDRVAEDILQDAAEELALLVATVIRRAPWLRPPARVEGAPVAVVTAGGVFAMGPTWRERVRRAVERKAPEARLESWVRTPLVGACYVALHAYYTGGEDGEQGPGTGIPEGVMANLRRLRAEHVDPF